ncbi:MAG: hypothetical protein AAEJ59_09775 [Arenicellales bacterium]
MTVYRITRFTSPDVGKAVTMAEEARDEVAAAGADIIDIAMDDDGNGVVVAKYPDSATMEAATAVAMGVFGKMIAEGAIDGDSIDIWTGNVAVSI